MGNNAAVCQSITLYTILEGGALERLTRRKNVLKKMQQSAVLPVKLNIARTFQVVSSGHVGQHNGTCSKKNRTFSTILSDLLI